MIHSDIEVDLLRCSLRMFPI